MINKRKQEFYLQNPNIWCNEVIGDRVYKLHMRHSAAWRGFTPFQKAFMKDICNFDIPILYAVCNRGGSKTMLTAYATCCLLDNLDNFKVSILSGSQEQASVAYGYCKDILNLTRMKEKVVGDVTIKKTSIRKGGGLKILAASPKQTKAPRSDMLILDEVCSGNSAILNSVFGQVITAPNIKIVMLTTPDDINHIAYTWWNKYQEIGILIYSWNAFDCDWIPQKNIELFKRIFDEATYNIQVLAKWSSKSGAVFKHSDIQNSLCNMNDLPPIHYIDRFFCGIDWGDAHETVLSIFGLQGDVEEGTDKWFLYAVKGWRGVKLEQILDEIISICEIYNPLVLSEQSASSAFANRALRDQLNDRGMILRKSTFSKKKNRMVNNFKARLEKGKVRIPRNFKKTIEQLNKYHYKEVNEQVREEFVKVEDDYVDSVVHAHWGIYPSQSSIETIGEFEY